MSDIPTSSVFIFDSNMTRVDNPESMDHDDALPGVNASRWSDSAPNGAPLPSPPPPPHHTFPNNKDVVGTGVIVIGGVSIPLNSIPPHQHHVLQALAVVSTVNEWGASIVGDVLWESFFDGNTSMITEVIYKTLDGCAVGLGKLANSCGRRVQNALNFDVRTGKMYVHPGNTHARTPSAPPIPPVFDQGGSSMRIDNRLRTPSQIPKPPSLPVLPRPHPIPKRPLPVSGGTTPHPKPILKKAKFEGPNTSGGKTAAPHASLGSNTLAVDKLIMIALSPAMAGRSTDDFLRVINALHGRTTGPSASYASAAGSPAAPSSIYTSRSTTPGYLTPVEGGQTRRYKSRSKSTRRRIVYILVKYAPPKEQRILHSTATNLLNEALLAGGFIEMVERTQWSDAGSLTAHFTRVPSDQALGATSNVVRKWTIPYGQPVEVKRLMIHSTISFH